MRIKTINLILSYSTIVYLFVGLTINSKAQENTSENFRFRSFGLSMGVYNPELDYWKNDTNSRFKGEDFSTSIFVQGFVEFTLVKNLIAKGGFGYWQTHADTRIPNYGKTSMLLTGTPLSLDLIYFISPARLAFITPYVGIGGELLLIQYNLDFEDKENPDPVNGSSALGTILLGLESKLSGNFTIDLFFEYKTGNYQQSFIREVTSPIPNTPSSEIEVTENISLNGPKFGVSLKYLF